MRLLKIWPVTILAGLLTAVFWAAYYKWFGNVPQTYWEFDPRFSPDTSFSRWFDVPSIMVLVALFTFAVQKLYRHVLTWRSAAAGLFITLTIYASSTAKTGWIIPDTFIFVLTGSLFTAFVLSVLYRLIEAGPIYSFFLFFTCLLLGALNGFLNGSVGFFIGIAAGIVGFSIGNLVRLILTGISYPIYLRFRPKRDRNHHPS